ncbi:MAG: hypothetical protein AAGH89_07855 [Verrucomicrobiota bacterium]
MNDTILIDFGAIDKTISTDWALQEWNNVSDFRDNPANTNLIALDSGANLVYSTGDDSGIVFSATRLGDAPNVRIAGTPVDFTGTLAPNPTGTSYFPAALDSLFVGDNENATPDIYQIALGGLSNSLTYDLTFLSAWNAGFRDGDISVELVTGTRPGGNIVSAGNDNAEGFQQSWFQLTEVTPAAGEIVINFHSDLALNFNGRLNTMEITPSVGLRSSPFSLTISRNGLNPDNYDFAWTSLDNKVYALVSSTDLSTPVETWPVWEGNENIVGTAPENTLPDIPGGVDPARFFVVIEMDPPLVLTEDFESGVGGFTVVDHSAGGAGTDWAHGDPDSSGLGGSVTTGNGGSTSCWGTDIGNPGNYSTDTDTSLISPVIDLTAVVAAELSFAQAIDILDGDTLVVNVIDDTTDTVLQAAVYTSTPDLDIIAADWETVSSVTITGGEPVRIEWRFTGDGDGTYLGAYIDDVIVSQAMP